MLAAEGHLHVMKCAVSVAGSAAFPGSHGWGYIGLRPGELLGLKKVLW